MSVHRPQFDVSWITPDWPAPRAVRALSTLRAGGASRAAYAGLNLGDHVGDDAQAVADNRTALMHAANLPAAPCWLSQVHGARALDAAEWRAGTQADACWTAQPGQVCAVLSADCLPVLFCTRDGDRVAAAHAGWRGLLAGVLEAALAGMAAPANEVMAWLGPAIGPESFEVGDEVRAQFVAVFPAAQALFRPGAGGRWMADLYGLARLRLREAGVTAVHGGGWCTLREAERFYSYRRDGATGRMASLIWLEAPRPARS